MKQTHLSATSILTFKANPGKYNLRYEQGLLPIEDETAQRVGTNWHELHEIYNDAINAGKEDPYTEVMNHLNKAYAEAPLGVDITEWATERITLAVAFTAYLHYWQDFSTTRTVATEISFDLPLTKPGSNYPMLGFRRVGKIDNIQARDDQKNLMVLDYKSTSKDIGSSSDYWKHLRLDTQISMYVTAMEDLLKEGKIPGVDESWRVNGAMLDVWRKPGIRPAKITQKETKELLETGKYLDFDFEVVYNSEEAVDEATGEAVTIHTVIVDGEQAQVHPGKRGFAINETPGMYGARLAKELAENPSRYFVRREVPRTMKDRWVFRKELWNIARLIRFMRENDCWYVNEQDDRYPCRYMKLFEHGFDYKTDGIPEGFKQRNRK